MKKYCWFLFLVLCFFIGYSYVPSTPDGLYKKGKAVKEKKKKEKNSPQKPDLEIAKKKGKYGVLDKKRKTVIIPYQYDKIIPVNQEGFALFKNTKWNITDINGTPVSPESFKSIYIPEALPENEPKRIFIIGLNSENKNTLVFKNHTDYTETTYSSLVPVPPYYYSVSNDEKNFGIINFRGELAIPLEYNEISLINNHRGETFAKVKKNGFYGCINLSDGKIITLPQWNNIELLTDDTFLVEASANRNIGIINRKGGMVLEPDRKRTVTLFSEKLIRVEEDKSYFVTIDDPTFTNIPYFPSLENFSIVKKDSYYGVTNPAGEVIIPFEYTGITKTSQSVFIITRGNKSRLANYSGNPVTPFYDDITYDSYTDNFIVKSDKKKWGLINYKGDFLMKTLFKSEKDLYKHLHKNYDPPASRTKSSPGTMNGVIRTTGEVLLYVGLIILDILLWSWAD